VTGCPASSAADSAAAVSGSAVTILVCGRSALITLKALARRSAVPVSLDVQVTGRLPESAEIAVYYLVAEALTNTAKHTDASIIDVQVESGEGELHVCVRDDGRGGAHVGGGSGLAGLKDRMEALGGRFSLDSPPGAGTALGHRAAPQRSAGRFKSSRTPTLSPSTHQARRAYRPTRYRRPTSIR
jgi:signal transduction histidine kinase